MSGIDPSLVRAMGGPSSGKAGVTRDPEETNRIIAEASKNSKYFQEIKRRDEQLRERIKKLLARRDEIMQTADIAQAEAHADQLISTLSATRDLSKTIVHVDLDAFYASVEALADPDLVGKAFGVGKGVLTTASYEARKFGVRSGMATFIARKLCPHIIIVGSNYQSYSEKSKIVMDVLRTYDPDMCIMGADEAYLTMNEYCDTHTLSPEEAVQKMRQDVFEASQLTCSAGIATNRTLAKICSDKNKPNGQYFLPPTEEAIMAFMADLPIRKIPGIGRVSERVLTSLGINTCSDVYLHRGMLSALDSDPERIAILAVGLGGLVEAYLGLGSNVVAPPERGGRKSIGCETTFNPISDTNSILAKLEHVAEELEQDMERTGWAGKTITLKYKLDTHQVFTRARALPRYVTSKSDLLTIGRELLMKELPLRLRLIGLRVTALKDLRPNTNANGIEKFFNNAAQKKLKLEQDSAIVVDDSDPDDPPSLPLTADTVPDELDPQIADDRAEWEPDPASQEEVPLVPTTSAIPGFPDRWVENEGAGNFDPGPSSRTSSPRKAKPASNSSRPDGDGSSASASSSRTTSSTVTPRPNSTSSSKGKSKATPSTPTMQTCPICWKEFVLDNAGLNAHVDYCLSKGTIMEAAASSSTSEGRPSAGKKRKSEGDVESVPGGIRRKVKSAGVRLGHG